MGAAVGMQGMMWGAGMGCRGPGLGVQGPGLELQVVRGEGPWVQLLGCRG